MMELGSNVDVHPGNSGLFNRLTHDDPDGLWLFDENDFVA